MEEMVFEDSPSRARRLVRDGDTIVATVRTYLRAIAPVTDPPPTMVVSTGFAVIRPRALDPGFTAWVLRGHGFVEEVVARSVGVSYPAINAPEIGNIPIAVPPLDEQRDIAVFLDRETARIDSLIAKKRLLIERLQEYRTVLITRTVTRGLPPEAARAAGLDPSPRLKPSGVEWLGDVPEHWLIPKLSARYEIVLGKMLDESRITGQHLVPYLRNIDVQWDSVNIQELPEMDIRPKEFERYTVCGGDVLVCEGGEPGRSAIVPEVAPSTGFQKALHRLRPLCDDENPRFLFYTLAFAAAYGVFEARGNPNTILHLTGEMLQEYRFPQPPTEEQQIIVDYLDKEVGRLKGLTERVEAAISRLHEYRTALISAAVTGKIDVRDAVSLTANVAE
jgi:type I restriction enzyme S subunit